MAITSNVIAGHHARVTAAWNAIVPERIVAHATRYEADAILVLHPTKGWRRVSHKRLGIA